MVLRYLKTGAYTIADRLASVLYDPRLPPVDPQARLLAEELRASVSQMSSLPARGQNGGAENAWLDNLREMRVHLATADARSFLRWDVVRRTMFVSNSASSWREWKALKRSPQWPRWQSALQEDAVGRPVRFLLRGTTSGNQVHHTYHLSQFEERTGRLVNDMGLVLEFGGGYGSMCRQVHRLGFAGRYVIFDLPEFSALQRYFLRSIGLNVLSAEEWSRPGARGILLLSDLEALRAVLAPAASSAAGGGTMFLATWSLSESPESLRKQIVAMLDPFDAFLIAYQSEFGSVDNVNFFKRFIDGKPHVRWHHYPVPGMRGNFYLLG